METAVGQRHRHIDDGKAERPLAQRFGELKRRVAGISAKMLTERLRTLEGASLVRRDYEATIPPKVTYSLTQRGNELDDVLGKLAEIGMRWEAEDAALRAARAAELKAAE